MSVSGPRKSNHPPKLELPMSWSTEPATNAPRVSAAWISRPRTGESVNGDAVIVRPFGSAVLVAVIDALGHGPKAADVAQASAEWLGAAAPEDGGAPALVNGLHKKLHGSRGAAALLFLVSTNGIEACSVGNVELRSMTGKLPFVLTPGVLGVRLRAPKICSSPPLIDRFVLHSDGISGRFDLRAWRTQTPSDLASLIFGAHRHAHDDATVVVIDIA
jgi:negative regulator of sigma-B (phosphoserine phosphatase)